MRRKFLVVISILFALSFAPAAFAQVAETVQKPPITVIKNDRPAVQEIRDGWAVVKEALKKKDKEAVRAGLKSLEESCVDHGITSFEELSASMVKQGKELLDANEVGSAMALFDSAIRISPDYPPSYYAKGWAYLINNKFKVLMALDAFIEGFTRSAHDFWWSFYFAGNKFTSLLFTLAILFSLFGLFMAVRYSPLLAHDISEALNNHEIEDKVKFAAIPILFTVVLLTLGFWWAATLIFLALWVYFNKKEKALAVLFFILLVFMPEIMTNFASFAQAGGNRLIWVVDEVNKGRINKGAQEYLRKALENSPDNETVLMSLAQIAKKEGRLPEAVSLYNKLVSLHPDSAVYLNNLGNALFLMNDPEGAINKYNSAISYEPKRFLPYFNLSQVYSESLKFNEREQVDRKARELDPVGVAELRERAGETPVRMVFDEQIPAEAFWGMAFNKNSENKGLAGSLWGATVKVLPLQGARVAGIGFIVLAFAVGSLRKKGNFAHFCQKCGKVSCRKCQRPHFSKELCAQCHQIFVKLDGVEARDRVRKMLEIREKLRHDGLKYRILSSLLPGTGHFLTGHPIRGFIYTGFIIFLIKDLFFGNFYNVPYAFDLPFVRPDAIIMTSLLILIYIIALFDIRRVTK